MPTIQGRLEDLPCEFIMQRVVVVLGGNAFAAEQRRLTMEGQQQFAADSVSRLQPFLTGQTPVR